MIALRNTATLAALLVALPIQAEDETLALDRFSIGLGTYETELSAEASYKRADEDGTRRYGASEGSGLAFAELAWRPFDRHSFRAAWFDHDRSTRRTLSEDVDYGNAVYPVGATLDGRLAVRVFEFDWTYWAWLSRRNAFGPVLGIVRIGVDTSLAGVIDVEDIGHVELEAKAGESLVAPKAGLSYVHAFDEHWRVTADVGTFERSFGAGDARIWDASIGLEWNPYEHWGLALRHARTRIDADVSRDGYAGNAEVGFGGWQFLVRAHW